MTLDDLGKWLHEHRGVVMLQVRHRGGQYQVFVCRRVNGAHTREIKHTVRGDDLPSTIGQAMREIQALYEVDRAGRADTEPPAP